MSLITSTANPLYKKIQSLDKSRERRKQGLFWVEGQKEVEMALANGFEPEVVIYSSRFDRARGPHLQQHHYVEFSSDLFERVCYRESVSDIGAIFKVKPLALNSLKLGDKPFVLILESVEKPGNLGAVLRTADAAGVNAVIVCDPICDFYNPNAIRSSVGTLFSVPFASASTAEVQAWLKKEKIQVFTTFIENSKPYTETSFGNATALVLGTEAYGLTEAWRLPQYQNCEIPMRGQNDSLNISVAAAVLAFEVIRQRSL